MATQKIIWTVLPKGLNDAGELLVSVVPSFRLTPENASEQVLAAFRSLSDWPKRLGETRFSLRVGSETFALRPHSQPESALWRHVFHDHLPVRGYVYNDLSGHNLRSFPVRALVSYLHAEYGAMAGAEGLQRPSLFGPASPVRDMLGRLGIAPGQRGKNAGIGRWFRQPSKAEGEPEPALFSALDSGLDQLFFSAEGVRPEMVTGIDGKPKGNGDWVRRTLPVAPPDAGAVRFSGVPEYALYQANRFYQRPENMQPYARQPVAGTLAVTVPLPEFDFHRLASSFGDAPDLMRQLGLVLDMVIEGGEALQRHAAAQPEEVLTGQMQLVLPQHQQPWDVPTSEGCPATAFRLAPRRFTCATRTSRHQAGLLALAGSRAIGRMQKDDAAHSFSLTAIDPDGAALKTVGFALTMETHLDKVANPASVDALKQAGGLTYSTGQEEGLAVLRSGGLTLIENDRAAALAEATVASSLKNDAVEQGQADAIVFYAEDLLRGYRVDVRTEPGKSVQSAHWRSLCQRQVEYGWLGAAGPALPVVHDEGHVSGGSTTSKPATDQPAGSVVDHYLHEAVFKWTGWSLAVPRPGRRIRSYPDSTTPAVERALVGLIQEELVDEPTAADAMTDGSPISRNARALPGSLPRLRFGESYRMRARLVDLAGNSLQVDDGSIGNLEQASEPVPYLRYEPVDTPVLALRSRVSEGESLERMVIRSNFAQTSAEYLQQYPYQGNVPANTGFAYAEFNERHLVPPKTSQIMAEQMGVFEHAFGKDSTSASIAKVYADIVPREAGTLYHGGASVRIVSPLQAGVSAERALVEPPPEGFRLLPGEYVIHGEASLLTPYLPDPAATAIVLRGVPGIDQEMFLDDVVSESPLRRVRVERIDNEELVLIVPLTGDWPSLQGFRLVIAEHPDEAGLAGCIPGTDLPLCPPRWDGGDKRVLTVFLRKGEIAPLRYSSALRKRCGPQMAIPELTSDTARVLAQAMQGVHWMITPDRPLTLVHATQQPVCAPLFESLGMDREVGQTWVELSQRARVRYHARSTAQLDVLAEWMEWLDDPALPAPVRRRVTAQLPQVAVPMPPMSRQEPASQIDFGLLGRGSDEAARAHVRHEFGDHKFRLVRYRLRATTRFKEYLPVVIAEQPDSLVRIGSVYAGHGVQLPPGYDKQYPDPAVAPGGQQAVAPDAELGAALPDDGNTDQPGIVVPCSHRPAAPKVAYVMPTFRWTGHESAAGAISTRQGNGLRIYLERPWFSSGEGELLGVVVSSAQGDQQAFSALPEALIGHVSQWGQDPILASKLPHGVMTPEAFAARVATYSLLLPEAGRDMLIAAHRVHYDHQRRLWYADLEIDAGPGYNPFVRLALVRVQPHALEGCALSAVVHTQFAQLLPTRELHVERKGNIFELKVFGPAPEFGSGSGRGELRGRHDTPVAQVDIVGPIIGYDKGRNRIEMVVQQQDGIALTDLDWIDVAGIDPLSGDAEPGQSATVSATLLQRPLVHGGPVRHGHELSLIRGDLLFSGRLVVPPAPAGTRRRLLVREYERHFADAETYDEVSGGSVPRPQVRERLVFARELYLLGYSQPAVVE